MDYGMFKEGLQWNRLYLKVKDTWIEETFEAQMRVSQCLIALGADLNEVVTEMDKAIAIFPDRAEPRVRLGRYLNQQGKHELAYKYLSEAKKINIKDIKAKYILFVDEHCYGKYINDELSVACYWTQRYKEGLAFLSEIIEDPYYKDSKDRLLLNSTHFKAKLNPFNS